MKKILLSHSKNSLGTHLQDKQLFTTALTHKTYAFEAPTPVQYNERFEFLGDSILNFIISEHSTKATNVSQKGN